MEPIFSIGLTDGKTALTLIYNHVFVVLPVQEKDEYLRCKEIQLHIPMVKNCQQRDSPEKKTWILAKTLSQP